MGFWRRQCFVGGFIPAQAPNRLADRRHHDVFSTACHALPEANVRFIAVDIFGPPFAVFFDVGGCSNAQYLFVPTNHIIPSAFHLFVLYSVQHVSPQARDLIGQLIRKKAEDRLPLERVPQHPWIVRFTTSNT